MLSPDPFNGIAVFIAVAEAGGFTAAAARLGISAAAVSQAVKQFEMRLGMPLFVRTTRHVALTEAGTALLARAGPAAAEVSAAIAAVGDMRGEPSGLLRLTVPRMAIPLVLEPVVPLLRRAHPKVAIEIAVEDATVDLPARGFDAGIRIGEYVERDMIAVKLVDDIRRVCVASPKYLEGREIPQTPRDLIAHQCIRHRWSYDETIHTWEFEKDGERVAIDPQGQLIVNEMQNVASAAVAGIGIAYLPAAVAAPFVVDKRLLVLLPDWSTAFSGLFLYYPSRRQVPAPLQVFIDFAKRALSRPSPEIAAFDQVAGVPKRKTPR